MRGANQSRGPNRKLTTVATIPGQRARSTLPASDTPQDAQAFPAYPRGASSGAAADPAAAAWQSVTPSIAGTPHVRISKDGGRTYPARHARPLPPEPPGQPCTVPVFDSGHEYRANAGARSRPGPRRRRPPSCRARPAARAAPRPVRRRRLAERRPPHLCPVLRVPAVAGTARPRSAPCAALSVRRPGADVLPGRPDQPSGCPPQVWGLASPLDVSQRSQGGRGAPERAGDMGRAADRVRGRAAPRRAPRGRW